MTYVNDSNNNIRQALYEIKGVLYRKPINGILKDRDDVRPGYLIVTSFDENNPIHLSNIKNGKHSGDYHVNSNIVDLLMNKFAYVDGALLVDNNGIICRVGGRLLNNIDPDEVARSLNRPILDNEWQTFGFAHNVNTRHINALYASFIMPETTVFTMSGKTGDIRTYEKGRIISSTIPKEINLESLVSS